MAVLAIIIAAAAGAAAQESGTAQPAPLPEPTPMGTASAEPPVLRLGPVEVTDTEITLDGRLDDEAWSTADVATGFLQRLPDEGAPATQGTEVRILHDGTALWIGARLHDSAPDSIVALLARRDVDVEADWIHVYLDSYDDRRTAFGFSVSAAGVQRDVRISEDTRRDASWDAVWDSEVTRDALGWAVEMRIPLSQLRFDGNDEAGAQWGLNIQRTVARRNEESFWAATPAAIDRFVSLFGRLEGVDALKPARAIELIPYTVARLERAPVTAGDPFHAPSEASGSIGADIRMGLGRGLTLTATVNPDFGQVEADPATVNLTAFEIFQQERRPFFVEGGDLFDLTFPVWPPFFYTRRIGRAPQGGAPGSATYRDVPEASTILGAVKVAGKTEGGWSIGLLEAVSGREEARWSVDGAPGVSSREASPLTNHAAARVVRELRDGRSGIGLMATALHRRIGDGGLDHLHDAAYGLALDGWHRFADDVWQVDWGILGSHVRGDSTALIRTQQAPGHDFQRSGADHLDFDPTRTSLTGFSVNARVQKRSGNWKTGTYLNWTNPGFEVSDFGFNPVLDHVVSQSWLRYESYTPGRIFRNWNLGTSVQAQSSTGGELKEATADAGFFFTLRNWWGGGVWVMRHLPGWTTTHLRGGPALRRPGRWMGNVTLNTDRRSAVSGDAFAFWMVEDEGDGWRLNGRANLAVRPSDRVRLSAGLSGTRARNTWQWVTRRTVDGTAFPILGALDQTVVSLPLRADVAFSPTLTLQGFVRPFIASGAYGRFMEVADPAEDSWDRRFGVWDQEIEFLEADGTAEYHVDRDGDGATDLSFSNPDFNTRNLQLNAVLRWEYRPGSTLFVVWTHDRSAFGRTPFDLETDLAELADAPGRNVFMVKATWWMGF